MFIPCGNESYGRRRAYATSGVLGCNVLIFARLASSELRLGQAIAEWGVVPTRREAIDLVAAIRDRARSPVVAGRALCALAAGRTDDANARLFAREVTRVLAYLAALAKLAKAPDRMAP